MAQDYGTKITTNGLTFFDEGGTMLRLSFLDESLSVQFGFPEVTDGKRKYPTAKRESLIITNDRVAALYQLICSKVLPAIEKGENYDGGVFTSKRKDAIFAIIVQDGEPHLAYYKDIDADRKPKSTHVFTFTRTAIIEHYDPAGSSFEQNEIHAQFTLFIKMLEGFTLLTNNITTHSYRHANKYTTDKIFLYLSELAKKMGVTIDTGYSSYGASSGGYSNEQLPFGNDTETSMPSINEVSTLDGML